VWLAKVAERGMCAPSLVHPKPVRQLRDLTRYRRTLIRERAREKQRLEKILEDAQIKLSVVVSDLLGVSGRAMIEALIAGERNPWALARLARGTLRNKTRILQEALSGHFDDHHGFLCQMMLERIDGLSAQIETLDSKVEQTIAPFSRQVTQLDEIAGVGTTSAQELIAEIGVDMSRFPTAGHLVSWAKFAPIDNSSAGKKKGGSTGKGNPWIGGTLGEIVIGASRTHTFLAERYRRIARRRGKKRAIVATGNTVLTIAYHLLSAPEAHYTDLGAGFYDSKTGRERHARNLIRQLEHLTGKKVALKEAA
jgi:transposase